MKLADWCRLSADRRRHFPLTVSNVNAHAAMTRTRLEDSFRELGPVAFARRAMGVELQHVSVMDAVRELLATVGAGIVRAPQRQDAPFVVGTAPDSFYAGKPVSVFAASDSSKSWVVALRDALPVADLLTAARASGAADVDALLASRADLAAVVGRPEDPSLETEEAAIARVRMRRAIAEDLASAGGLGWILHGTRLPEVLAARPADARTRARIAQVDAARAENGDALMLWQVDPATLERPIAVPPLAPPTPDEIEREKAIAEKKRADARFADLSLRLRLLNRIVTAKEQGTTDPEAQAELDALPTDEETAP